MRWRGGGREIGKGLVAVLRGRETGSKILGKNFLGGIGASARAGLPHPPWVLTCTLQTTVRNYHTRFRRGHGSAEGTDLPEVTEAANGAPRGPNRPQGGFFFLWAEVGMASWEK